MIDFKQFWDYADRMNRIFYPVTRHTKFGAIFEVIYSPDYIISEYQKELKERKRNDEV